MTAQPPQKSAAAAPDKNSPAESSSAESLSSRSAPAGNSPAKRLFVVLFVAAMVTVAGISVWSNLARWHDVDSAQAQSRAEMIKAHETLEIDGASGKHSFTVEVARDDAQRAKGLMFRQSMAPDHGMLFDFGRDQPVSMWMKNTYIALDMLFLKADGTIHRIAERTEPMSERTISSGGPVRGVLEINAGVSEKLGLRPGDRIIHPLFPAK